MLICRAENDGERQLQLSTLVSTKRNEALTQAMTLTYYFFISLIGYLLITINGILKMKFPDKSLNSVRLI